MCDGEQVAQCCSLPLKSNTNWSKFSHFKLFDLKIPLGEVKYVSSFRKTEERMVRKNINM